MFGDVRKRFHMGKFFGKNLPATHTVCSCTSLQFLVLDGNCWALRHRKQNLVHVHTEMLSRPGRAATSMPLSSISSTVKLTSMMEGDKNLISPYVRRHKLVHFIESYMTWVVFQIYKPKQTVEPAQYGLEISFKTKTYFIAEERTKGKMLTAAGQLSTICELKPLKLTANKLSRVFLYGR